MKRNLSNRRCLRCGRPTARRRGGRPICLVYWVALAELDSDKKMRKMGKLKGTRGRS